MRRSLLCLLALVLASAAGAGEYVIGPQDVLEISVWEHPELSATLPVDANGRVVLPPVGEVEAAGLTAQQLGRRLEEVLEAFLRRPVQVTVRVVAYNSRRIMVTGDVRNPGTYSFPAIPGFLEVLGAAGGPNPTADLSRIRLLRAAQQETSSVVVDLEAALRTGRLGDLPRLQPGDVLYVPARAEEAQLLVPGQEGVAYVLGAVARPGPVQVGKGLALTRLVALAGGTLPGAWLERIRILAGGGEGSAPWILEADLEEMLRTGDPGPTVRPGELVFVPPRDQGTLGILRQAALGLLGVSRDLLNLFLVVDYLENR
jgi:polysaccharide export outer membrane protein